MNNKRITIIFLSTLAAIFVVLSFLLFRPFIYPLISALVIGIVFAPVHKRVESRLRRPGLAAAISTLLVILVVALPVTAILAALSRELVHLRQVIEERSADSGGLAAYVQGAIDSGQSLLGRYVDLSRFNVREWVLTRAREIGAFLVAGGVTVLGGLTSFLINSAISLFTLYFVFREGKALRRRIAAVLPLTGEQVEKLFAGIESTIVGTVYGGLVVAAVQGALVGLALWAFGVASPVLWGVVAAFFALLPLVGTAAVWVPAALYLLATGSWVKALILVAWCAVVVGTVDNVIRPLLIKGRVEMHTLLVFFAVFGGVNVFGFLGLIIGPVIVAITATLLGLLRDEGRTWATAIREAEAVSAPASTADP